MLCRGVFFFSKEGVEQVLGSTDMALKCTDCGFVGKSSGLADFENTVYCGSPQCEFWREFRIVPVLMFGSCVLNEIWIIALSSALVGGLMNSS